VRTVRGVFRDFSYALSYADFLKNGAHYAHYAHSGGRGVLGQEHVGGPFSLPRQFL
jgi:hypothetical protein